MGKKKNQQAHSAVAEKKQLEDFVAEVVGEVSATHEALRDAVEAQPQVPEVVPEPEVALRFIDTSSKLGHGRFMTREEKLKEKAEENEAAEVDAVVEPKVGSSAPKQEPELPTAATLIDTSDRESEPSGVVVQPIAAEGAASPVGEIRAGGESPEGEGATPISVQQHEDGQGHRGIPSPALSSVVPPVPNTSYNSSPDEHLLPPPTVEGEETDSSCDSDVTDSKEEAEQAAAVEIVKILAFRITVAFVLTALSIIDRLRELSFIKSIAENDNVQTLVHTLTSTVQRAWEQHGQLAKDLELKVKEVSPNGKKVVKMTKRSIQLVRLAYQAVADEVSRIRHYKVE
jgi:hypothetical protein